jgi:hypothetical protein
MFYFNDKVVVWGSPCLRQCGFGGFQFAFALEDLLVQIRNTLKVETARQFNESHTLKKETKGAGNGINSKRLGIE